MNLEHNHLNGSLPDLSDLTHLTSLNLQNNSIRGPLLNVSELPSLKRLEINHNLLTGYFDPQALGIPQLDTLYIRENNFWCNNQGMLSYYGNLATYNDWIAHTCRSFMPTYFPSVFPTGCPSGSPTLDVPTVLPTKSPSGHPSFAAPTIMPTANDPTALPSGSPSTVPTISVPSLNPVTSGPTSAPTISSPTSMPSIQPSICPTSEDPTVTPSTSPTHMPTTDTPSVIPTVSPSVVPTLSPSSEDPTVAPTQYPSAMRNHTEFVFFENANDANVTQLINYVAQFYGISTHDIWIEYYYRAVVELHSSLFDTTSQTKEFMESAFAVNVTIDSTFATFGDFGLYFDCISEHNSTGLEILIERFGNQKWVDRFCEDYLDPCYFVSVTKSGPLETRIRMVLELGSSQEEDSCSELHALNSSSQGYLTEDCFTFLMFEPSKAPVNNPSYFPSSFPSRAPSLQPSVSHPTSFPSRKPTPSPSFGPSFCPSLSDPTSQPSVSPSASPQHSPTMGPSSSIPSEFPSNRPSEVPSRFPSHVPSPLPSVSNPSTPPSIVPTISVPSVSPSNTPSRQPSAVPSNFPSKVPSRAPTPTFTYRPTKKPSKPPSFQPSQTPNLPTIHPSKAPITAERAAEIARENWEPSTLQIVLMLFSFIAVILLTTYFTGTVCANHILDDWRKKSEQNMKDVDPIKSFNSFPSFNDGEEIVGEVATIGKTSTFYNSEHSHTAAASAYQAARQRYSSLPVRSTKFQRPPVSDNANVKRIEISRQSLPPFKRVHARTKSEKQAVRLFVGSPIYE